MTKIRNTGKSSNSLGKKKKPKKKRSPHKKSQKNVLTSSKKVKILQDLKVKHVQIDIQKQEILQQRDQIEISRDKYADLYDFAPVGYLTLDDHGVIIESNLTASVILGIESKYIQKIPFINVW